MPKIRQYTAQVSPLGATRSRRAYASDIGDSGLGQLGKAISGFGAELQAQQDKNDKIKVDKMLADQRLAMTRQSVEIENSAELGAEGHVGNIVGMSDETRNGGLENVPDRLRDYYNAQHDQMRQGFAASAVGYQARSAGKRRVHDFNNILDSLKETVITDPSQYDEAISSLDEALGVLNPAERELVDETSKNSIGAALWDSQFSNITTAEEARNLQQALTADDTWANRLSSEAYARANKQIDAEVRRQEDIERGVLAYDSTIQMKAYGSQGGTVPMTEEAYVALGKTDLDEARRADEYQLMKALGDTHNDIEGMSRTEVAELGATTAEAASEASGNEALVLQEQALLIQTQLSRIDKQLKDDPAGYVIRNNKDISDAWDNMHAAMEAGDAEKGALARKSYVDKSRAELERNGVAASNVSFIPQTYADGVKERFTDLMMDPEKPQAAADFLMAERDKWGEDWGEVSAQLTKAGAFTGAQAVAARMAGSRTAVDLVRADQMLADKTTRGNIRDAHGGTSDDVSAAVGGALGDVAASMGPDFFGSQWYQDNAQAVSVLAEFYAATKGLTLDEAATLAKEQVLDTMIQPAGTYFIPRKEIASDTEVVAIDHGARHFASHGLPANLAVPEDADNPAAFREALTANGVWRVGPNATGLVLTAGDKVIYQNMPDGSQMPYIVTWDELKTAGITGVGGLTPQEINRLAQERGIAPEDLPAFRRSLRGGGQ